MENSQSPIQKNTQQADASLTQPVVQPRQYEESRSQQSAQPIQPNSSPTPSQPKSKKWLLAVLIVVGLLIIGVGYAYQQGYLYLGLSPEPSTAPVPTSSPISEIPCTPLSEELTSYQFCEPSTDDKYGNFIKGPNQEQINYVTSYLVSPNNKRVFVIKYSDRYGEKAINGEIGAPEEQAASMIDIETNTAHTLFSYVYAIQYSKLNTWSPDGKGVVFTAGPASEPPILEDTNLHSVVYCETTCRVLANDAGPDGIVADPAYFVDGLVHYSQGELGKPIEIPAPSSISAEENINSTENAQNALVEYFYLLSKGDYVAASNYHGSEFDPNYEWNPNYTQEDYPEILERGCNGGFNCLQIGEASLLSHPDSNTYIFEVGFVNEDGSIFLYYKGGGGGPDTTPPPPESKFEYTVKFESGEFRVKTPPLFTS